MTEGWLGSQWWMFCSSVSLLVGSVIWSQLEVTGCDDQADQEQMF